MYTHFIGIWFAIRTCAWNVSWLTACVAKHIQFNFAEKQKGNPKGSNVYIYKPVLGERVLCTLWLINQEWLSIYDKSVILINLSRQVGFHLIVGSKTVYDPVSLAWSWLHVLPGFNKWKLCFISLYLYIYLNNFVSSINSYYSQHSRFTKGCHLSLLWFLTFTCYPFKYSSMYT